MQPYPYAIWLLPTDALQSQLTSIINNLSRRFSTSKFEPHLTLFSGMSQYFLEDRFIDIFCRKQTLSLAVKSIGESNSFFQSFYIELTGNALATAFLDLSREFPDSHPSEIGIHVSLMYSEPNATINKQDLAKEILSLLPSVITFDSASLVTPATGDWHDIHSWKTMSKCSLSAKHEPAASPPNHHV